MILRQQHNLNSDLSGVLQFNIHLPDILLKEKRVISDADFHSPDEKTVHRKKEAH
jgi:hypothetical protein